MKNTDNNDPQGPWWKPGVLILMKVSGSIAIPIILALFIGKYLDTRYHMSPWIFLGLTGVAFIISLVSIWKNLSSYLKKIEDEENK